MRVIYDRDRDPWVEVRPDEYVYVPRHVFMELIEDKELVPETLETITRDYGPIEGESTL